MTAVAIVRPAPGAGRTARAARAHGLDPLVHSLFEARPLRWEPPDPALYDGLIVTSANGLRLGGPALAALQHLPVHAVGTATADTARALGFTVGQVGHGGVDALAGELAAPPPRRFLRLAGRNHVPLIATGMLVDLAIVYAVDPLPMPAPLRDKLRAAAAAKENIHDGALTVLLHSPRAARHFSAECDRLGLARATIALAALSAQIADAAGDGWRAKAVAQRPDDAHLLSILADPANQPDR